jgi:hypothetical protein
MTVKRGQKRPWLGRVLILSIFLALAVPRISDGHPAYQMVDLVWEHLGGRAAYAKARFVEFTFAVEKKGEIKMSRKHAWDRYTGDYVLEFTDSKTNEPWKVIFNIDTKKGVALKNGAGVSPEENAKVVERAYGMFCNDTYWLLAPAKLEDPGAKIQFVGHAGKPEADGSEGEFVVLHLFFAQKVGVTPGDQYWLNVTHQGQIVSWRYLLEGGSEGEWQWVDEQDCGMGITLSMRKVSKDGESAIVFPHVRLSDTMDRARFQRPSGS